MKKWLGRLALLSGALVVSLVLAVAGFEIYLRTAGAARFPALASIYDFYLNDVPGRLRLQPGYHGSQVVEGRRVSVDINSMGMRGPEIPAPAPDQARVLFLGDSIPFGHGVEAAESFPARTQALLRDRLTQQVVVGNAGIPGASHNDEIRQLERLNDPFRPDLIVSCVYTGNDFEGDFFGPKKAIDGYWFGTEAARLIESSWRARLSLHLRTAFVLEQFLDEHLPALAMDRSAMEPTPEEQARYAAFTRPRYEGLFMDEIEPTPAVDLVLDRMADNLRELRRIAGPVPVVVAIVPSFAETWPGIHPLALKANRMKPRDYERGLGARRLADRCRELNIPCIDLTPVMAAHANPNSLYLPTDLHLSVAGNEFVAEQLAPALARSLQSDKVSFACGKAPCTRWVGSKSTGPAPFSLR